MRKSRRKTNHVVWRNNRTSGHLYWCRNQQNRSWIERSDEDLIITKLSPDRYEKIIEDLFYNNAKNLYLSNKKESSKSYKKFLVLGVVVVIGIGIYAICKNDREKSARKSCIN